MTTGFYRVGRRVEAHLDADEAQAVALVVAQVAGLVQGEAAAAGAAADAGIVDPELVDDGPDSGSDAASRGGTSDEDTPSGGPVGGWTSGADRDTSSAGSGFEAESELTDAVLGELMGLDPVPPPRPRDPALARLFPDGYTDDPEAAAELRRLTHASLRALKIGNATTVLDGLPLEGGRVRLDAEGSRAWMLALNDARLVLGTRLELTDDTDLVAELDEAVVADPTGPRVLAISLYQFLSFLLETLIDAMDR